MSNLGTGNEPWRPAARAEKANNLVGAGALSSLSSVNEAAWPSVAHALGGLASSLFGRASRGLRIENILY